MRSKINKLDSVADVALLDQEIRAEEVNVTAQTPVPLHEDEIIVVEE